MEILRNTKATDADGRRALVKVSATLQQGEVLPHDGIRLALQRRAERIVGIDVTYPHLERPGKLARDIGTTMDASEVLQLWLDMQGIPPEEHSFLHALARKVHAARNT